MVDERARDSAETRGCEATAIIGLQYGDEGKGKWVDALAPGADWVVRAQGGANAGHTIVNGRGRFVTHLVPSGVMQGARCLLATGMVIDPEQLCGELTALEAAGIDTRGVFISERAHLLFPRHLAADREQETRRGERALGTTLRGIGPAYADKANRSGVRASALRDPFAAQPLTPAEASWLARWSEPLTKRLIDPAEQPLAGRILLEGQLGLLRDLDWGAYPYVTSSSLHPGSLAASAGIPAAAVRRVIGVVKAYTTAVGAGPFPTEGDAALAERLRTAGAEYGATTGRPRRCGWFDAAAVRHAARLTGCTELALTKLDVLAGFERIQLGVGYEGGAPVYATLSGWTEPIGAVRRFAELPAAAQRFVERIESEVGVPIGLISVGPERDAWFER